MDFLEASNHLIKKDRNIVNVENWNERWEEHYVIFADLIAFAQRCMLSTGITMNNIIRFHRAINSAVEGIENISKYQFTDACYVVTRDAKTALIVASNIQNECFLQNYSRMQMPHPMFYHMIVPKVVISKGNVLMLKDSDIMNSIEEIEGLSAKELLAGAGIVKAYYLEKKTTGGLISVDKEFIVDLKRYSSGDSKQKTNSLYKKWRNDENHNILSHDGVVDIPWLVLQPKQVKKGVLLTESVSTFKEKVKSFNLLWRMNFTEHLAEGTSTETLKQYGGGLSHLCELMQNYSNSGPRSWDLINLNSAIDAI